MFDPAVPSEKSSIELLFGFKLGANLTKRDARHVRHGSRQRRAGFEKIRSVGNTLAQQLSYRLSMANPLNCLFVALHRGIKQLKNSVERAHVGIASLGCIILSQKNGPTSRWVAGGALVCCTSTCCCILSVVHSLAVVRTCAGGTAIARTNKVVTTSNKKLPLEKDQHDA